MTLLMQIMGWLAAFGVVGAYFWSVHVKNAKVFDWANAVGSFPLVVSNVYFGVWFGAFISAVFGSIGLYAIYKSFQGSSTR